MSEATAKVAIEPQVPKAALQALEGVVDPEIPVLTIADLGILRGMRMEGDTVVVTITPTYVGCPAMVEIRDTIHKALLDAGFGDHRVETSLAPAWTTDWMSEEAKQKLREYGIAPPSRRGAAPTDSPERLESRIRGEGTRDGTSPALLSDSPKTAPALSACAAPTPSPERRDLSVPCPQCGSEDTRLISAFGSTPCKALYQCKTCQEPFDHFKCH